MTNETDTWAPAVRCDLTAGPQAFQHAVTAFRKWAEEQPRPKLDFSDGWHTITPEMAEQLLICNARNRALRWSEVLRYGTSMANKRWKKTGETVIITDRGDLEDAGHRLFASYFSNCSFETYVVNVPHDEELFAYIDDGVSRNGQDTLQCAGLNGLSKQLQAVIKNFAIRYDEKLLTFHGRARPFPISNVDILDYARANPELVDTAHIVADLYPTVMRRLDSNSVAVFLAWKIRQAYGTNVLDDFMNALQTPANDLPAGHPVATLLRRLDEHEAAKTAAPRSTKAEKKLTDLKILVLAMRAFNFWRTGSSVRRLDPRMDDPFPSIEAADEEANPPMADADPMAVAAQ